ncbi:MAG: S8 family serine peptidase [Roseburia sp.]
MAPGAAIYAIKVLDRMGKGNTRLVVSTLKWLISNYEKMNIRILNISVGMLGFTRREEQEELLAAIEAVWDAGIVVHAAAGNNGPRDKSITIPGLCRKIITVGSSDDEEGEAKNLVLDAWV